MSLPLPYDEPAATYGEYSTLRRSHQSSPPYPTLPNYSYTPPSIGAPFGISNHAPTDFYRISPQPEEYSTGVAGSSSLWRNRVPVPAILTPTGSDDDASSMLSGSFSSSGFSYGALESRGWPHVSRMPSSWPMRRDDQYDTESDAGSISGHSSAHSLNSAFGHHLNVGSLPGTPASVSASPSFAPQQMLIDPTQLSLSPLSGSAPQFSHGFHLSPKSLVRPRMPHKHSAPAAMEDFSSPDPAPRRRTRERTARPHKPYARASSSQDGEGEDDNEPALSDDDRDDPRDNDPDYSPLEMMDDRRFGQNGTVRDSTLRGSRGGKSTAPLASAAFFASMQDSSSVCDEDEYEEDDEDQPRAKRSRTSRRAAQETANGLEALIAAGVDPSRLPTDAVIQFAGATKSGRPKKVFVCSFDGCNKCFKRSEHLKRHIKSIHSEEKPYVCPFEACGRSFSRPDNMHQHLRVHGLDGSARTAKQVGRSPS